MSELDCSQCTHFRQHYVLSAGVYVPLNYGHCVARRRKKLAADSECCEHFMRAEKEVRSIAKKKKKDIHRAGCIIRDATAIILNTGSITVWKKTATR